MPTFRRAFLTGLAAAHVPLVCPGRFTGILCQSASFWWSDNRLVDAYRSAPPLTPAQRDRLALLLRGGDAA